jgi:hypothetical protein
MSAGGSFIIPNIIPGDYYLGVNISDPPREGHGLSAPWQPTYFPGVQNRAAAAKIHVSRGEQLQGFEFPLAPKLKQRTIRGFVHWPNGKPAMAFVELRDNEFAQNVDLANTGPDGSFTVTGVVDRVYSVSGVTGPGERAAPMHSPKVDIGLSMDGPVNLVLSIPGRN